jgi:hypothetical protein
VIDYSLIMAVAIRPFVAMSDLPDEAYQHELAAPL